MKTKKLFSEIDTLIGGFFSATSGLNDDWLNVQITFQPLVGFEPTAILDKYYRLRRPCHELRICKFNNCSREYLKKIWRFLVIFLTNKDTTSSTRNEGDARCNTSFHSCDTKLCFEICYNEGSQSWKKHSKFQFTSFISLVDFFKLPSDILSTNSFFDIRVKPK